MDKGEISTYRRDEIIRDHEGKYGENVISATPVQQSALRDVLSDEFEKKHKKSLPKVTKLFKRKKNEKKRRTNWEQGDDEASFSKMEVRRRYQELKAAKELRLQKETELKALDSKTFLQHSKERFHEIVDILK